MNMFDRHDQIVRALSERAFVSVAHAVQLTGGSPATIRRDFTKLTADGIARRVRSGIRTVESVGMTPFAMREVQYSKEKEALAQKAAALLKAGDTVFIDGGTTTFHLGACLPKLPLRVITNSLRLAVLIDSPPRRNPHLEIFLTGGCLYPNSGLLVGPGAHGSLAQYHANWAFLSVGGITAEGLFNTTEQVVETERRMIANADKVALLADPGKIGRHAMCHVCPLDGVDLLITNHTPSTAAILRQFEEAGMQVVIV